MQLSIQTITCWVVWIIDLRPPGLGFVLLFCWILFLWISVKNLSEDSISTVGPIVHLARTHITFNYPPATTHTKLIFVNKNVKIFVIPIKISSNSWTRWKGLGSRTENCLNGLVGWRRYFLSLSHLNTNLHENAGRIFWITNIY